MRIDLSIVYPKTADAGTQRTVSGNRLILEGHELRLVEVGQTDTEQTSVPHVPNLSL